jgi:hypothetical protein
MSWSFEKALLAPDASSQPRPAGHGAGALIQTVPAQSRGPKHKTRRGKPGGDQSVMGRWRAGNTSSGIKNARSVQLQAQSSAVDM